MRSCDFALHVRPLVCVVLALATAAQLVGCGTPGEFDPEAVEASARTSLSDYLAHINALELEEAAAYYEDHPGFRWLEGTRIAYSSAGDARAAFLQLAEAADSLRLLIEELEVQALSPTVAVANGTFRQTIWIKEAGVPFQMAGAMTVVMQQRGDSWRFVAGHTSTGGREPEAQDSEGS